MQEAFARQVFHSFGNLVAKEDQIVVIELEVLDLVVLISRRADPRGRYSLAELMDQRMAVVVVDL